MSVSTFNIFSVDTLTELASFEALLSPKNSSDSFFLRVFALNARMAIEKLIVNLPLDWQGDILIMGDPTARKYFVFSKFVCESLEQC